MEAQQIHVTQYCVGPAVISLVKQPRKGLCDSVQKLAGQQAECRPELLRKPLGDLKGKAGKNSVLDELQGVKGGVRSFRTARARWVLPETEVSSQSGAS